MKYYSEMLYDDIGNTYERKNQYLKELSALQATYSDSKEPDVLAKIKTLEKGKESHPYIKALALFRDKEKAFKKDCAKQSRAFKNSLPKDMSFRMRRLKTDAFKSKLAKEFYEPYVALSHDAAFAYEKAVIEEGQYTGIIAHLKTHEEGLKKAQYDSRNHTPEAVEKAKKAIAAHKAEEKALLDGQTEKLKKMRKEGVISKKALKDGINEATLKYKDAIQVKSYELPTKKHREAKGYRRFEINKTNRRKENVLKSNVSDLRRKTPYESDKKRVVNAFVSCLVPGVGQVMNRQFVKGFLFLLTAVFIYAIAIPYALGYGNYQGEGIAGLVSLAEGGRKIDKSMIFLIEGVMAIFLCIISLIIYYVSFRDVYQVEKERIKGIRPRVWFESKTTLFEEGFPIMVSLPALLVTVFIVLVPITTTILLSFTNMNPKNQSKFQWAGFANYKMMATGEGIAGQAFWLILQWTVIWTLVATTLAILIGFVLAILVNGERIKGKAFFRAVYLLPWAVPAFITIMFFSIMFSPGGLITGLLDSLFGIDLVVKQSPFWTRVTLIGLQGWLGSSYVFLLSTGVLQAIPADLYEAAQIDGASAWQKLRKITLPIVLFQTAPLLVGQYTFNFNNFSVIYLFNGGGPFEPTKYGNLAGSTDLLISYIYKLTMENDYQAIGAAITILISLGLMFFAWIGFHNSKAFREEKL